MKKISNVFRRQVNQALAWAVDFNANAQTGKPYLSERDGILALHFDALSVQSTMNVEMPDELILDYTRAMMAFLLINPLPGKIAMIGLGGGSLAKYCYRYLPATEITVIEINPDVIALRNEFAIPPDDARFHVVQGDGADWVINPATRPDVLIVDGFEAGGMPDQLSRQEFYDNCFSSLADKGILVANLWSRYPLCNECVKRIRKSFAGKIVAIDAEDRVNRIAIAVKDAEFPPALSKLCRHVKLLGKTHPLDFQAKADKLIQALPKQG